MPTTNEDYKILYQVECTARIAAERKYNDLERKVLSLMKTIHEMAEPARRIEEIMRSPAFRLPDTSVKATDEQSLAHEELANQHKESAEKHS